MAKKTPTLTKAVIYCRFSPRRNSDDCESNETQLHYCRAYCAKQGWKIVAEKSDEALSGDEMDRPGLWEAVELARRGVALVVYKADRLARDVLMEEMIRSQVNKAGGRVITVEGTNGDSAQDDLLRTIMAAVAQYEKKMIAARTRAAMLRHQASGRAMSHIAPYGMTEGPVEHWTDDAGRERERRTWVPDPDEQKIIKLIMAAHKKGEGLRPIARMLAEQGLKARGKEWNHLLVRSIVRRAQGG
jgi:site-specific DNA recombinase